MQSCPYCDYDLGGLADPDRCPECGHLINADYIEALMRHRGFKDEQALYKIAMVGWSVHAIGFVLLVFNPYSGVLGLMGLAVACLLIALSVRLTARSRATWPRRFARNQGGVAPRGLFFAMSAWVLPSILLCGLVASISH